MSDSNDNRNELHHALLSAHGELSSAWSLAAPGGHVELCISECLSALDSLIDECEREHRAAP